MVEKKKDEIEPLDPWRYKQQIINAGIKIKISRDNDRISQIPQAKLEELVSKKIGEKVSIVERLMEKYPEQSMGGFGGIHPFWKEYAEKLVTKLKEAKKLIDNDEDKDNIVGYLMIRGKFDPGIVFFREGGHAENKDNFYAYLCGLCESGLRKAPLSVHPIAVSDEFNIPRLDTLEELRLLSRTDVEINTEYNHKGAVALVGIGCLCGANFVVAKDVYIKVDRQEMTLGYSKGKLSYIE